MGNRRMKNNDFFNIESELAERRTDREKNETQRCIEHQNSQISDGFPALLFRRVGLLQK